MSNKLQPGDLVDLMVQVRRLFAQHELIASLLARLPTTQVKGAWLPSEELRAVAKKAELTSLLATQRLQNVAELIEQDLQYQATRTTHRDSRAIFDGGD